MGLTLIIVHTRVNYLVLQLQSVSNFAACLIFSIRQPDHISPALVDLPVLPYTRQITYKLCMIMFECLQGLVPAYLADCWVRTSLVPG